MRVKAWAIVRADGKGFRTFHGSDVPFCLDTKGEAETHFNSHLERAVRVEIRELRTLPARKGKRKVRTA